MGEMLVGLRLNADILFAVGLGFTSFPIISWFVKEMDKKRKAIAYMGFVLLAIMYAVAKA